MMKLLPYILIIGILVFWTLQRNAVYRSEVSLAEDNFVKSPNKPRVCVNLAYAYKKTGEDEKGIAALTRAFQISPDLILYFRALDYVYSQDGYMVVEKDVWDRR